MRTINLKALEELELMYDSQDYWISSIQLAIISGRKHYHVLRDIRRDIEIAREIENNIKDASNIGCISKLKIKIGKYRDKYNREKPLIYLNRKAALSCLIRYDYIIRSIVIDKFFEYANISLNNGEEFDDFIMSRDLYNATRIGEMIDEINDIDSGLDKSYEIKRIIDFFIDEILGRENFKKAIDYIEKEKK